jgi:hypothetical protein
MRQLNGVYAQRFNRRHGRVGHLFQARFHSTLIEQDEHLLAVSSYLPLNPVRAGLCADPATWRWSSYRATIGLDPPGALAVDRLLGFFADDRELARDRYQAHVEARVHVGLGDTLRRCVAFGSDEFAALRTRSLGPLTEVPRRHWQPVRPSLAQLLTPPSDARIADAFGLWGYTMSEIACQLGVHYATISRRLRRYEERVLDRRT